MHGSSFIAYRMNVTKYRSHKRCLNKNTSNNGNHKKCKTRIHWNSLTCIQTKYWFFNNKVISRNSAQKKPCMRILFHVDVLIGAYKLVPCSSLNALRWLLHSARVTFSPGLPYDVNKSRIGRPTEVRCTSQYRMVAVQVSYLLLGLLIIGLHCSWLN